jgi:hypothetical protein
MEREESKRTEEFRFHDLMTPITMIGPDTSRRKAPDPVIAG